jgi:hypothetical protein
MILLLVLFVLNPNTRRAGTGKPGHTIQDFVAVPHRLTPWSSGLMIRDMTTPNSPANSKTITTVSADHSKFC